MWWKQSPTRVVRYVGRRKGSRRRYAGSAARYLGSWAEEDLMGPGMEGVRLNGQT